LYHFSPNFPQKNVLPIFCMHFTKICFPVFCHFFSYFLNIVCLKILTIYLPILFGNFFQKKCLDLFFGLLFLPKFSSHFNQFFFANGFFPYFYQKIFCLPIFSSKIQQKFCIRFIDCLYNLCPENVPGLVASLRV